MVLVQVPIIDHENPFYCPSKFQLHSDSSDVDLPVSPLSRKSATTQEYGSHKGVKNRNFDTGTSNSSIYPFVYAGRTRNRVTNNDLPKTPVVGHQLAGVPYDLSPCAKFPPHPDEMRPARKRARYTSSGVRATFGIPEDGEQREPCGVKQEYSSPVLPASSDQDDWVYQTLKESSENSSASALEYGAKDTVTTRTLLLRLDDVFPRVGFREAAELVVHMWPETSARYRSEYHQALVDMLGERGALNEYVLSALHDAEFRHLDLGPTMRGVNELDLPRGDIMRVFNHPGWFKHLKTLSFAGGRFRDDFSLAHIQPLRQIEKLVLENTSIGNEGIFHIVALKHKLRYLDLSGNLLINDDSIPALILLENLQYLSVFGTGILMPGLRKLAVAMKDDERVMDVKIPRTCKDYINGIYTQYLMYPEPPLISDPGTVSMLSKAALLRNLEAHAAINPTIISTGSHEEMEERLRKIMEVRNHDLVVREMLVR